MPSYDGPIPGIENIDVTFGGSTTFDPFLLDGMASTTANIPETKLPPIPLPGGVPGVLQITIAGSSTMTSELRGVCAGVTAGPGAKGTYRGEASTTGQLKLLTAIEIKIPLLGSKSFAGPDIDLPLGPAKVSLDLGTKPVPGGGAAVAGGSVAKLNGCSAVTSSASSGAGGAGSGGAPSSTTGNPTTGNTSTGSNSTSTGTGGGMCVPGDISMYKGTYHPPSGAHQGLCTTAQINAMATACLDSTATSDTCTAFRTAAQNTMCADCLITDSTAPGWGPVVTFPNVTVVNYAGCIVALDSSYTPCAKAIETVEECSFEMCKLCDGTDQAAFDACYYSSYPAGSDCEAAETAGQTACAPKGSADPYATCALNADTTANFIAAAQAICGQ